MRYTASVIALTSTLAFLGTQAVAADDMPHWSYSGENDPSVWSELSSEFQACGAGQAQSPINIETSDVIDADVARVDINWQPFVPDVINNGHTVQVNTNGDGGYAEVNGTRYDLLQYHFHHLSEHTIDGEHRSMEVHFVHKSEAGDLLVVGALIEEGAENPTLARVWPLIPTEGGETRGADIADPSLLIPSDQGAYRYAGSLTTPPCSEIVTWNVMIEPITASAEQIEAFAGLYPENYRPVQDGNRRFVLKAD